MNQDKFIQILPAYMGCEIDHSIVDKNCTFVTFMPDDQYGVWGTLYYKNVFGVTLNKSCQSHSFKLILRTFDQMTDEESAQFRQLADDADKHSYRLWAMYATKAVNYLRSIGIDCDGLIEAGYAVMKMN